MHIIVVVVAITLTHRHNAGRGHRKGSNNYREERYVDYIPYLLSGFQFPLVLLLLRLEEPLAPLLHGLDFLAEPVVTVQLYGQPVLVLVFQLLRDLQLESDIGGKIRSAVRGHFMRVRRLFVPPWFGGVGSSYSSSSKLVA